MAFEHNLGAGRNLEVEGLALHQLDRPLAQESSDQEFLDIGRSRNDSRESQRRIGPDGDRDFHLAAHGTALGNA